MTAAHKQSFEHETELAVTKRAAELSKADSFAGELRSRCSSSLAAMVPSIEIGTFGIWTGALDLQPIETVRTAIRDLDAMGWGCLWRPESTGRDALVSAALYLDACPRMAVATGIAQIHARHPMTTMAAARTLDEAFPGRFLLGLGVSHAPLIEDVRGLDYSTPLADMAAHLNAMDAAPFTGLARSGRPPRVLAALGPRMLQLAAEKADGAHPYLVTPDHTALARSIMGPDKFLAPEQMVLLETDSTRARAVARSLLARYLDLPNYANNLRRIGFTQQDIDTPNDRLVDALVVWGDAASIARRVREHLDAGADHVCLQALTGDPELLPFEQWRELADAVL